MSVFKQDRKKLKEKLMVFIYGRSNRDLGINSGGNFSAGSSSLETDDAGDLLFSLSLYEN